LIFAHQNNLKTSKNIKLKPKKIKIKISNFFKNAYAKTTRLLWSFCLELTEAKNIKNATSILILLFLKIQSI
jgi:hypothetical protein